MTAGKHNPEMKEKGIPSQKGYGTQSIKKEDRDRRCLKEGTGAAAIEVRASQRKQRDSE